MLRKSKVVATVVIVSVVYAFPKIAAYVYKWWFRPTRWYTDASRHEEFKSWLATNFGIGETTLEKYQRMAEDEDYNSEFYEKLFNPEFNERFWIDVEDESEDVDSSA